MMTTSLGFGEVYDYVGSKMEWIGAGLPWEGGEASQPKLGDLATADVAFCALEDTVSVVRATLGQGPVCLVVNEERIVLSLVRAEALSPDDDRSVTEVMDEGPSTYRPHVPAAELAERLDEHPEPRILVTTLDGGLVGMASARTSPRRRDEQSHHPVDDHAGEGRSDRRAGRYVATG